MRGSLRVSSPLLAVSVLSLLFLPVVASAGERHPAKKATIAEVARVVEQGHPNLMTLIGRVRVDCFVRCDPTGQTEVQAVSTEAKSLHADLDAVDDRSAENQRYVGEVPKRLRALVKETLTATRRVAGSSDALTDCLRPQLATCEAEMYAADNHWSALKNALAQWKPYLLALTGTS
jgi:hypothetical protein